MDLSLSVWEMEKASAGCLPGARKTFSFVKPLLAPVEIQENRKQLQVKGSGVPGFGALLLFIPFFLQSFVSPPYASLSSYEWA